jgi:hypothetical protein
MPRGLQRFYGANHLHFITSSCYQRRALLSDPMCRDLFVDVFEQTRIAYRFIVIGYAVMPEHFRRGARAGAGERTNTRGWPGLSRSLRRPGMLRRFPPPHRRMDSQTLSPARRPLRLNLHSRILTCQVVTETAPSPVLGPFHQSAFHWISMHIA